VLSTALQRKLLFGQILAQIPEFGPVSFVLEVGVQFVVGDCVLVEEGAIVLWI
jgi:hypothetical protein